MITILTAKGKKLAKLFSNPNLTRNQFCTFGDKGCELDKDLNSHNGISIGTHFTHFQMNIFLSRFLPDCF